MLIAATGFLNSGITAFLRGHGRLPLTRLRVILLMKSGSGMNEESLSPTERNEEATTCSKASDASTSDPMTLGYLIDLLPSREPYVSIEIAPSNARRIFTGVDIMADMESIWEVLTSFDRLQDVVPSLVKNEVQIVHFQFCRVKSNLLKLSHHISFYAPFYLLDCNHFGSCYFEHLR